MFAQLELITWQPAVRKKNEEDQSLPAVKQGEVLTLVELDPKQHFTKPPARFSDGEISVQINENVRGSDVFILQSTCAPTNDNLMELIVMVDALRRASAGRITAVIPYFGYARQDRRVRSARVPITAKVVAEVTGSLAY